MLKTIITSALLLFSAAQLHSQGWEFGAWAGASGYSGDLNPVNYFKPTDPAFGVNVRYGYSEYSGLKLAFAYGAVRADDANSSFDQHRLRNLSFSSTLIEAALLYEFYLYRIVPKSREYRIAPYVFAGVAGFMFEPKAERNGVTYNLRDLGTEGQGTSLGPKNKYSNLQVAIPFGVGIKYNLASNFNLGFELGYRNTFTDYLDDVSGNYVDRAMLATVSGQSSSDLSDRSGEVNNGVYLGRAESQRGDPSKRDFYMFTGITLSYILTPIKCPRILQ